MARPTNLAEYEALTGFMSDESLAIGLAYRPEPTDIFISPYSKCGTTWMQQIVHGLRSGGSMDFEEITQVVPWLEMAHDMGTDPAAEQVATPRAFKSHLRWDQVPKGGRYIVVLRDPVDAMVSLHRFMDGWLYERGSISIEEFAGYYLRRGADGYWEHAASWWPQREREDVLLLTYEDMKADLAGVVDRVADHMGQGYDADRLALATRQAEFSFMKAHADQFNDNLLRRIRDPGMGLPPTEVTGKVSKGKTNAEVPQAVRDMLDRQWAETLGSRFGLASYRDMRDALASFG